MSDKEEEIFMKLAYADITLMIVAPILWTIIFWNSPLLIFNVALPILIMALFALPALAFIFWKLVKL